MKRKRCGQTCKKGNIAIEGIVILVIIFVMALVSIFAYKTFDELNSDIASDEEMGSEAKDLSQNMYIKFAKLFDNVILFAFVLLLIFTIVGVFMLDTHPIFFAITIMLLIAFFVVTIMLANSYDEIMQDSDLSSYANEFTYTTWVMQHVLQLMIAAGFILAIALFIKVRAT